MSSRTLIPFLLAALAVASPAVARAQIVQNVQGDRLRAVSISSSRCAAATRRCVRSIRPDGEPADGCAGPRRQQRCLGLLGSVDQQCPDHRPRRAEQLALMLREGGALAIIDRLAPLLVPEGSLWAQYVAGVVLR